MVADKGRVARRRVFYIPGYDPFPTRRYRELYRSEGAKQAALSGFSIKIAADGPQGWRIDAEIEGSGVETRLQVMEWADLVQDSMARSIPGTYAALAHTAWVYLTSGAFWRLTRLRTGPVITGLYPALMLIAQLALALALGWGAVGLLRVAGLPPPLAWLGLGLGWPVLSGFRRIDRHLLVYYMMHDYAYFSRSNGANPAGLQTRMLQFDRLLAESMASDADEVLLVGHSSGAQIAVSLAARLIRSGRVHPDAPVLSLLTLGQAIPVTSFLPEARELRADLHFLAARDDLTWVDVSAPGDGASFALCDPVAVSAVAPPGKRWPLVISAAFTQTLRPETWARLRWRFFRLHFQYLCAFDALTGAAGEYDYFRTTAGPLTLAARFQGRAPSASRIETPASGHVTMAA